MNATISRVAPAIPAWIEFTPVEPEAVEITAAKNAASDAIKEVLRARHVAYVEAMEAH